jgi:hypothetical protein
MGWKTGSVPRMGREFSLPPYPEWIWDPPSLSGALSLGVKWLDCEADHSTVSNAGIKNAQSCTSASLQNPHGRVLNPFTVNYFLAMFLK